MDVEVLAAGVAFSVSGISSISGTTATAGGPRIRTTCPGAVLANPHAVINPAVEGIVGWRSRLAARDGSKTLAQFGIPLENLPAAVGGQWLGGDETDHLGQKCVSRYGRCIIYDLAGISQDVAVLRILEKIGAALMIADDHLLGAL